MEWISRPLTSTVCRAKSPRELFLLQFLCHSLYVLLKLHCHPRLIKFVYTLSLKRIATLRKIREPISHDPRSHDPDPGPKEKSMKKSCTSFETECISCECHATDLQFHELPISSNNSCNWILFHHLREAFLQVFKWKHSLAMEKVITSSSIFPDWMSVPCFWWIEI